MTSANNDNYMLKGHFVYKYVYDNTVIYVGKTDCSLDKRLKQHGKKGDNIPVSAFGELNASKIYYSKLLSAKLCDIYESELIRRHKPKYNKAKTQPWDGVVLPELIWNLYIPNTTEKDTNKKEPSALNRIRQENLKLFDENNELRKEIETLEKINNDICSDMKTFDKIAFDLMCMRDAYELSEYENQEMEKKENHSIEPDYKYLYNELNKKYNELLKEHFAVTNLCKGCSQMCG